MERFAEAGRAEARGLVDGLARGGRAEVRRDLAGPLAVRVVAAALELLDADPRWSWAGTTRSSVPSTGSSAGGAVDDRARDAVAALDRHVGGTIGTGHGVLASATATLTQREVVSNAAVMMFGGIETSEGMTTSLFWHVLRTPRGLERLADDRARIADAVEESLRLEPAAARVDRYATADVELAGARIRKGDLVIVSLTAANRDPATFPDPDTFDIDRPNLRSHVAFAQGPHACVGLHLARLETHAALDAALDGWPGMRLESGSAAPTGVVFRKPRVLPVTWDPRPPAG